MLRRTFLQMTTVALAQTPGKPEISGIYPHLAMYNSQSECGTGGVVPWAGKLWVVTYSPHQPLGSDDKLYEIDAQLNRTIRPESIGGTPANRMIHRESDQLFIGPYAIDEKGAVRTIPYSKMPGRPTGNARHLTDPAGKIYLATMEEGFYEVDVRTLVVRQLYEDANAPQMRKETKDHGGELLPGYHGKGFYSGQGRAVYANNGEIGGGSLLPDTPSGCLAEWNGKDWKLVRRNQFTEVTGPGGIWGNPNPEKDPIWAVGWDHRSLILMLLDKGVWHSYRLPKATHTYDGAHGWNTEWPRIREIGENDLLMTMHGMFWRFPKTFSFGNSTGIAPRSTYLRVVGDFAHWQGRIVFGCDDSAKSEFFNTRRAKGKIAAPGQSQSNLWFVEPSRLDRLGVPIGRGGVWIRDDVKANEASEPFLFSGFDQRMIHLAHESETEIPFTLEVDVAGNGSWSKLRQVKVPAGGYMPVVFTAGETGTWVRVKAGRTCRAATAFFHYANTDRRTATAAPMFAGLVPAGASARTPALLWARGEGKGTLLLSAGEKLYELDADLRLRALNEVKTSKWMAENLAPPKDAIGADAASVVYTDEGGKRWRLPKGDPSFDALPFDVRVAREVSTERDLLNAHGTFYELPSNNAGGISAVRPIATHNLLIRDYCSWRGFVVMSGGAKSTASGDHIVRSDDGQESLWLGVSDDLWQLGKPRGVGGPWKDTAVKSGEPSDPYLMTGYDRKLLRLSHGGNTGLKVRVEIDVTGTGLWVPYATLDVPPGRPLEHKFPAGLNAYWIRTIALTNATVSAVLTYS